LLTAFACEGFGQGKPEIRLAGAPERLELMPGECGAASAAEVDRALSELTAWLSTKAARPGGGAPKAPAKKKNSGGAGDQG
jgi:hypothetical protein